MEISYKREMKHNYLVIEAETVDQTYEVRMMADNVIEGILKFRVKRVDDKCCYCYEITSRQPLSRLLENKCLKASEVRLLILGLAKTLGKLEEYLLKEEQILLQPEYIYVEPELFSAEFCLIPGRKSDFPAELGKLLEYLLGKVDYQDKACVVMTYGMYRESLKENYGIEDLLKFLTSATGEQIKGEELEDLQNPSDLSQNTIKENQWSRSNQLSSSNQTTQQNQFNQLNPLTWSGQSDRQNQLTKQTGQSECSILSVSSESSEAQSEKILWKGWLREKLSRLRGKKNEKIQQKIPAPPETELPWQMVFTDEPAPGPLTAANDTAVSPLPREYEEPEGPNTVLLYDKAEKQFRRLTSLEPGIPDIEIAYYPFIIGKQENLVDYVMTQETVSRLHLRIDETDGIYQITDLNSTNGTGVAGRILENNESAVVNPGDEVTVAGMRFKFG